MNIKFSTAHAAVPTDIGYTLEATGVIICRYVHTYNVAALNSRLHYMRVKPFEVSSRSYLINHI